MDPTTTIIGTLILCGALTIAFLEVRKRSILQKQKQQHKFRLERINVSGNSVEKKVKWIIFHLSDGTQKIYGKPPRNEEEARFFVLHTPLVWGNYIKSISVAAENKDETYFLNYVRYEDGDGDIYSFGSYENQDCLTTWKAKEGCGIVGLVTEGEGAEMVVKGVVEEPL